MCFVEPGADVGDAVPIEALVETARYIADMGSGKQVKREEQEAIIEFLKSP